TRSRGALSLTAAEADADLAVQQPAGQVHRRGPAARAGIRVGAHVGVDLDLKIRVGERHQMLTVRARLGSPSYWVRIASRIAARAAAISASPATTGTGAAGAGASELAE